MITANETSDLAYYTYQRSNWLEKTNQSEYAASYEKFQALKARSPVLPDNIKLTADAKKQLDAYHQAIEKLEQDAALEIKKYKQSMADAQAILEKNNIDATQLQNEKTIKQAALEQKLNADRLIEIKKLALPEYYLANKTTIEEYLEYQELKDYWDGRIDFKNHEYHFSFEARKNTARALAFLYGGFQGWGMAGLFISMARNAHMGGDIEWAIALGIALPVTAINTWLVRPDLEKYIAFKKYRDFRNGNISKQAIFITTVSSILLGGVVAYGITGSLESDNNLEIGITFGLMTAILALAEGLLNIGSLDDILKSSFSEKQQRLRDEYKREYYATDDEWKAKQSAATLVSSCVLTISFVGMMGIALVGSKTLANQVFGDDDLAKMIMAAATLLLAASAQFPFYQDRATTIAKRWVPVEIPGETKQPEIAHENLTFNPDNIFSSGCQKSLWAANAIFNAPCAYLGVVTTLGKMLNLEKMKDTHLDNHNTFEQIFFQYGNSIEATIVYGIGALFFIAAVGISMAANSVPPHEMADPKGEYEKKNRIRI